MLAGIKARGGNIKPRCTFKRSERPGLPGDFINEDIPNPKTRASFLQYQIEQIAADVKESICRTSDLPFDEVASANIPTVSYELPDGQEIHVGPDRFKVPEVLFSPNLIRTYADLTFPSKGNVAPLQELVLDSINRCDVRNGAFSLPGGLRPASGLWCMHASLLLPPFLACPSDGGYGGGDAPHRWTSARSCTQGWC